MGISVFADPGTPVKYYDSIDGGRVIFTTPGPKIWEYTITRSSDFQYKVITIDGDEKPRTTYAHMLAAYADTEEDDLRTLRYASGGLSVYLTNDLWPGIILPPWTVP